MILILLSLLLYAPLVALVPLAGERWPYALFCLTVHIIFASAWTAASKRAERSP